LLEDGHGLFLVWFVFFVFGPIRDGGQFVGLHDVVRVLSRQDGFDLPWVGDAVAFFMAPERVGDD
jgi:hypothetical protein